MQAKLLLSLFIFFLSSTGLEAAEVTADQPKETDPTAQTSEISVDHPVIDIDGLTDASHSLARLIDRLSASIERLATDGGALGAEDRAVLVSAIKSADQASQAVARLADQMPQIVSNASEPIAEVSTGFEVTITESMLVKLSVYTLILVVVPVVVIIVVMWFAYKRYVNPLAQKLDALVAAPEHLENMSRHMEQTSSNLLALQGESEKHRRGSQLRAS